MNKNSVKYLYGANFLQLTLAEKTEIKNLGHATPDRCFSTLKRVKTLLRSTRSQDHLCALAKKFIIDFNDKVIDKSANHTELFIKIK
jgi:hypothetical protein